MLFCLYPLLVAEPVEQVLPRQRTEGDDQTGRAENVRITGILCFCGHIFQTGFFGTFPPFLLPSFPEIRYFQDEGVRTKLTDILFCYARENEQLLYKQVRLRCMAADA